MFIGVICLVIKYSASNVNVLMYTIAGTGWRGAKGLSGEYSSVQLTHGLTRTHSLSDGDAEILCCDGAWYLPT